MVCVRAIYSVLPGYWLMRSKVRTSPTLCTPCVLRSVLYSMCRRRGHTMTTIWRGSWGICMLLLLVSCTSKQSAPPALHAANPQAVERLYQDGRVAFKERRYDEAEAL